MYILRPFTYKNGIYRSYKIFLSKKRSPHIGFIKFKFCHYNNFYNSFDCSVVNLKHSYKKMSHMTNSGYFKSNRVVGKALGAAIGGHVREIKKRRHY